MIGKVEVPWMKLMAAKRDQQRNKTANKVKHGDGVCFLIWQRKCKEWDGCLSSCLLAVYWRFKPMLRERENSQLATTQLSKFSVCLFKCLLSCIFMLHCHTVKLLEKCVVSSCLQGCIDLLFSLAWSEALHRQYSHDFVMVVMLSPNICVCNGKCI